MTGHDFTLHDLALTARGSGALYLPEHDVLCVSDLHLGKSDRIARRGGTLLPPYENRETLTRLSDDIAATAPQTVICLGDSFDDLAGADALDTTEHAMLTAMQAGRRWIWIEGNHDPGPTQLGGTHLAQTHYNGVHFRHIASDATPEVSGHYHPKCALAGMTRARACFVYDQHRLIMPAYGAYTGGLSARHPDVAKHFGEGAIVVLTGPRAIAAPLGVKDSPRRPNRRGTSG